MSIMIDQTSASFSHAYCGQTVSDLRCGKIYTVSLHSLTLLVWVSHRAASNSPAPRGTCRLWVV